MAMEGYGVAILVQGCNIYGVDLRFEGYIICSEGVSGYWHEGSARLEFLNHQEGCFQVEKSPAPDIVLLRVMACGMARERLLIPLAATRCARFYRRLNAIN